MSYSLSLVCLLSSPRLSIKFKKYIETIPYLESTKLWFVLLFHMTFFYCLRKSINFFSCAMSSLYCL